MLYGLDLFSGIGGITLALSPWVRPVAYCEIDRYAQGVLLSRMQDGLLPHAPVWDDVSTLGAETLGHHPIDIICGGFPCQDISVAGAGVGLDGKRSGLFFEVVRLVRELTPSFVFLENVPAIRTRGGERVVKELARLGYDCRWGVLSAADVGAPHKRERWWLLARRTNSPGLSQREPADQAHALAAGRQARDESFDLGEYVPDCAGVGRCEGRAGAEIRSRGYDFAGLCSCQPLPHQDVADSDSEGLEVREQGQARQFQTPFGGSWWELEPNVGRVAHGVPARVDRIKGLGNAVVPAQAREAFQILMGLK